MCMESGVRGRVGYGGIDIIAFKASIMLVQLNLLDRRLSQNATQEGRYAA